MGEHNTDDDMSDLKADGPNSDQIEYWNGDTGDKWVDAQEKLDPVLEPAGLVVMDKVGVRPGETVIDIGCGCGATSLELAQRVGPMGRLLGVDISIPMLRRAGERAAALGLAHTAFINADASNYRFEAGAADLVFSRYGVMFFTNRVEAFANIRKGLKDDGRLGFICWQPLDKNEWVLLPRDVALRHVPAPEPMDPLAPGPFAFSDPDRVRGILGEAGFQDIAIDSHEPFMSNPGTLDEVTNFLTYFGPASRLIADADDATKKAVENEVREAIAPRHDGKGVALKAAMWIVTARA
ncbi:MAG: class I SAM-dependent methyltransferase [Alphaproteobacteria bacterium]|jgi:ubiquinone/menaquinone biosynthesis C-methylase UbiE|nr:class I SAM-dependent methyltransferase [Rhodospirillaceae bacterium]MBT6511979.1 class I SAM-dependent methyltransferase [Rhodospirillaceae bacterium]MBT7648697.1 class I SAM-dependent methyltransferase [Rhodospirillaceae bacterium]MDG2481563.1 class I SAM-dependent methyltransferase [Alphaproteobacteria bacterium]